jgi:BolA protein
MADADTPRKIESLLRAALAPVALEIVDESHLHAGHAGARGGGGHYRVRIVSEAFEGKSLIARHRAVNAAVASLMAHEIHALSIDARAPSERPTER